MLALAFSLLAPPMPAQAGPSPAWACYGRSGYVATGFFQLNWGSGTRVATAWIAPAGQQSWRQVFSAGRTPSTNFMRFDTTEHPNGVYDLLIEFYYPPNQWQTYCYGRLIEIRNLPAPPPGLTVTPRQSSTDRFTFSWLWRFGVVRYHYSSQCGSNIGIANGLTGGAVGSQTSVTIANVLPYRGWFTFCVRAIDAAGNHSSPSSIYYEWQKAFTSLHSVSWPTTITTGSVVPVFAQLAAQGAGNQGQPVTFSWSYGAASAITDAGGSARTSLVFNIPGTFVGRINYSGDAVRQPASTTVTFQVVRDTTPPTTPTVRVDPGSSTSNSFTASWAASTDASGVAHYRYRINGGAESATTATRVSGPLAPGFGGHRIEVLAIDRAGNPSNWSAPATFQLVPPPSPTPVPTPPRASPTPAPTSSPDAGGSPTPSQRISVDIPPR